MLKGFEERRAAVEEIMQRYSVTSWKIFEDIPGVVFPTIAYAHFLIVPGDKLDITQFKKLSAEIEKLFRREYIEFYTPAELNAWVDEGRLKAELKDTILSYKTNKIDVANEQIVNDDLVSKLTPANVLQIIEKKLESLQADEKENFNRMLRKYVDAIAEGNALGSFDRISARRVN